MIYGPALCVECGRPFSPYWRAWRRFAKGEYPRPFPTKRCSIECEGAAYKRSQRAAAERKTAQRRAQASINAALVAANPALVSLRTF